jgi:hypothetical protein
MTAFQTVHGARLADAARTVRARSRAIGAPRVLAVLLALCCNALFSSSSCVVVYCSEDCNPCLVNTCKCTTCQHSNASFEATHRLELYRLSLAVDADGRVTRIYGEIVGLSLDRAIGTEPHTEADLVRFARNVLAVNAELLPSDSSGGEWELDRVETFGGERVVSFRARTRDSAAQDVAASTATMLFDARGNLIEIDHRPR